MTITAEHIWAATIIAAILIVWALLRRPHPLPPELPPGSSEYISLLTKCAHRGCGKLFDSTKVKKEDDGTLCPEHRGTSCPGLPGRPTCGRGKDKSMKLCKACRKLKAEEDERKKLAESVENIQSRAERKRGIR